MAAGGEGMANMIVSHQHRFEFFKSQKIAGTSAELALGAICGPGDIITPLAAATMSCSRFQARQMQRAPDHTMFDIGCRGAK